MDNASFSGHKRSLLPSMYFLMIKFIKYLKSNTHFAPIIWVQVTGGSSLSRETQTSLSEATSFGSSGGACIPKLTDAHSPLQCIPGLHQGLHPVASQFPGGILIRSTTPDGSFWDYGVFFQMDFKAAVTAMNRFSSKSWKGHTVATVNLKKRKVKCDSEVPHITQKT